jgi:hypothetical protein
MQVLCSDDKKSFSSEKLIKRQQKYMTSHQRQKNICGLVFARMPEPFLLANAFFM